MTFVNTQEFRREALAFIKEGVYCYDPPGSPSYYDYWQEQLRRCIEGYSVGGVKITGDHYFYLNFAQIKLTDTKEEGVVKKTGKQKSVTFPDFWDGDYEYFHLKDIAQKGITIEEYQKLNLSASIKEQDLSGGKHLIIAKARRKGYSYKNGAIAVNKYNTERNATILLGAFEKKYLYPQGTMDMASSYMNFLNEHTGWTKKRQYVDKQDHRRASYQQIINGTPVEKGFKSQIIALTFKDNPDASRGKDASLILFEEAGNFSNLKAAYLATKPTVEDGVYTTGQILIYGCVCAGTKVWTNDGRRINIEDIYDTDGIMGYAGIGTIKQDISWLKPPTKKDCYRIETSNNRYIECSHDHPLLWSCRDFLQKDSSGYRKKVTFKEAEKLKVGDQLMLSRQVPVFGNKQMWCPRLVGLLIGDGYYGPTSTPQLAIGDTDIYEWLKLQDKKITVYKTLTKEDIVYFHYVGISACITHLKDVGIYGQTKGRKHLPPNLHEYNKESIAELLGGYFDADGNVYYNSKKKTTRIVLTSAYRHLLEQVQEQLLRFGVGSCIRKEKRLSGYKKEASIFRLYIGKVEDVLNFRKHISFLCAHKQRTLNNVLVASEGRQTYNNCLFVVNPENGKGRYLEKNNGLNGLEAVFIKRIIPLGRKTVYNLNAAGTHTYLSNEFISANTGGDMLSGTLDFSDMFYNPEPYNLLAVENIWDENKQNTCCGYFVPDYRNKPGFIDKEGNSKEAEAKTMEEALREDIRRTSKDRNTLNRHVTEHPFCPAEAFLQVTGNIFPVVDLQRILGALEGDTSYLNSLWLGSLDINPASGKIEWKPDLKKELSPVLDFPLKKDQNTEGCIIVYEHPYEQNGEIPYGMYLAGTDPYDFDQSTTGSLGSTLVYNKLTRRIVAEYTARPATANEYYENVRRLLLYYNAQSLYENEKKGMFDYFESKNSLYLLADEPNIIKDIIQKPTVNRKKGMPMYQELKEFGEELIKTWLIEPYDVTGSLLTMHKVRSIPLLKELIAYNDTGNFDRVSALIMVMYFIAETRKIVVDEKESIKTIYDQDFFNTQDIFKRKKAIGF